jgi:hypothetical protein
MMCKKTILENFQNVPYRKILQKSTMSSISEFLEIHKNLKFDEKNLNFFLSLHMIGATMCRAPLHKGCPKHQGHKGDPGVTPGTCGADGEKAQVILVWVKAPGVGNASHPWRLGVMRVRP